VKMKQHNKTTLASLDLNYDGRDLKPELKKIIDDIPTDLFYMIRNEDEEKKSEKELNKHVEQLANSRIIEMIRDMERMKLEAVKSYYAEKPIIEEQKRKEEALKIQIEEQRRQREISLKEQEENEKRRNEEIQREHQLKFNELKHDMDSLHHHVESLVRNLLDNPPSSLINLYDPNNDHPVTAQILHQFETTGVIENLALKQEQEDESLITSRFAEQRRRETLLMEEAPSTVSNQSQASPNVSEEKRIMNQVL